MYPCNTIPTTDIDPFATALKWSDYNSDSGFQLMTAFPPPSHPVHPSVFQTGESRCWPLAALHRGIGEWGVIRPLHQFTACMWILDVNISWLQTILTRSLGATPESRLSHAYFHFGSLIFLWCMKAFTFNIPVNFKHYCCIVGQNDPVQEPIKIWDEVQGIKLLYSFYIQPKIISVLCTAKHKFNMSTCVDFWAIFFWFLLQCLYSGFLDKENILLLLQDILVNKNWFYAGLPFFINSIHNIHGQNV